MHDLDSVIEHGVGEIPEVLVVSEMCEIYHCTPKQLREEFSLYEQVAFWHIQMMKREKAAQDAANAEHAASGEMVVSHA